MSQNKISDIFLEIADAIENGNWGDKPRIGLTTLGSEHGVENTLEGAVLANSGEFDIVLIGPKNDTGLETIEANDDETSHKIMEELLDKGEIDACVTMHYNFPIGVSTVGRVITPGKGKEMIIATTTGTTATNRVEAMIKNTISGIATAKAIGKKNPTVGILNLDGARQVEKGLLTLQEKGYEINFASSVRADGGSVMRGNDLLCGAPDVMVTDSLTGNLLMKIFSSFTTGGDYESLGYGYGPGVGDGFDRSVLIVSRASGAPVIAGALKYAADVTKGGLSKISKQEYDNAKKAGLEELIKEFSAKKPAEKEEGQVVAPPKEVVTEGIAGVDILELDDAVEALWKEGIYAESGMGCTGPIVMVSEANYQKAQELLKTQNLIA